MTERGRNGGKCHLRLAFAREGGGGVEMVGNATSVSLLNAREVVGKRVDGGVKRSHDKKSWLVGVTHLVGLPLPGSPLLFLPPGSLRRRLECSHLPTSL